MIDLEKLKAESSTILHDCSPETKKLCEDAERARIQAENAMEAMGILANTIKTNVNDLREIAWDATAIEYPALNDINDGASLNFAMGQVLIVKGETNPQQAVENILESLMKGNGTSGIISGNNQEEVLDKLREVFTGLGIPETSDEDKEKSN